MRISNKKNRRTPLIVASVVLLPCIAAGLFYVYRSNTSKEADEILTSTQESGGGITNGRNTEEASGQPAPTPDSSLMPATPTGTFASNHRPNLSGSPAPNTIASTCTTTPGSECTIEFTKDGVTKSLPKRVADANGNVSWDWKLQDIGLTEGTWKIVAVASIGTNTTKESDALDLIVGL